MRSLIVHPDSIPSGARHCRSNGSIMAMLGKRGAVEVIFCNCRAMIYGREL